MKLKNIIVFLIILLLGVVIGGLISENRANKVLLQNYEQESNIEKMQENINTENKALDEENLIFEKEVNVKKEEVSAVKEVVVETNPIISNGRGDIYVENNTIYVNGFEFDKPSELYVIDQNESGVVFGDENTRSTGTSKFAIGLSLYSGRCYGRTINEIKYSCFPELMVDGLALPKFSFKSIHSNLDTTFAYTDFMNEIVSKMLTKYWYNQDYNREPQEIADLSIIFAQYVDKFNKIMYINNERLFLGPNQKANNPVWGVFIKKNNNRLSALSYEQVNNFNIFLNSCDDEFISEYINNLDELTPSLEDIVNDLSCAGNITVK
jgi:hypothetical protein